MFAINVVLKVKSADDVQKVRGLLAECGRLSRMEPGCLHYEANHATNEPQVFMLIERWSSKETWEAHRTAEAYTTIYAPQVIPLVDRTPYFMEIVE